MRASAHRRGGFRCASWRQSTPMLTAARSWATDVDRSWSVADSLFDWLTEFQLPIGSAWMAWSLLLIRKATRSLQCCMLTVGKDGTIGDSMTDGVTAGVGEDRTGIRGAVRSSDQTTA